MSMLIIKANLECEKCYKKIQKVLRKLKGKEKITKIDFDNPNNKVTISGQFDAQELSKKLKCKAPDTIRDVDVIRDEKEEEKKKTDDKKPADDKKKPADDKKKPEEGKKDDGKKDDGKKPGEQEKKGEEKPKVRDEAKAVAAPSTTATTVNLHSFAPPTCGVCYPWPCSDPSHWGGGHPQWPSEGMPSPAPAFPGHQHPPWGEVAPMTTPMKWPSGGPSYCGGCGSCRGGGNGMHGHGWPAMPAPTPQMCCPGPSSCRGCKGCRIVQEGKFEYDEYPPSNACAIM